MNDRHIVRLWGGVAGLALGRILLIVGTQGSSALASGAAQSCAQGSYVCNDFCCPSDRGCCPGGCCPSDKPHWCPPSEGYPDGTCYKYFNDAQNACGNAFSVCHAP